MPTFLDYDLTKQVSSEADATALLDLETKNIFRGLYLDRDSKKASFYILFLSLSTCNIFKSLQVNRKHGCHYTSCFVPSGSFQNI